MNRTALSSRLTVGSPSNSYPRSMQPRTHTHSHSLSVGSINPAHRVTRRKSMSTTASTPKLATGTIVDGSAASTKRLGRPGRGSQSIVPASLPSGSGFAQGGFDPSHSSAVIDGPPLSALPELDKGAIIKSRMRRASEGSRLVKGESKRGAGAPGDLRCETCGKGYKHSSCLTKHLLVFLHSPSHLAAPEFVRRTLGAFPI
jgi:hypothetical protein